MKIALLVALCSIFLGTWASPILTVESSHQEIAPVPSPNQQESARHDSGTASVPNTSEQESARQDSGTVPVVPAAPADSDDDDDDDDDDVDLDITDDDDDDDEDSEDAEEDDDDEDYFERFFDDILGDDDDDDDEDEAPPAPVPAVQTPVASASPASKPTVASVDYSSLDYTGPGSLETNNNNGVPPVLIAKYNRFTDNIMERINKILRKNYDPVNVRLQSSNNNNNSNNSSKNKNKNKNKHKNRRNRPGSNKKGNKRDGHHRSVNVNQYEKDSADSRMNESLAAISAQLTDEVPHASLAAYNKTEIGSALSGVLATTTELSTTKRSDSGNRKRPNLQHRKNSNKSKNKIRTRDRPTAKATLYGLSSIRREGDVTVNMMSSHTTVKTRFTVGPLILKVEKEFGRGAKKDIRSATATTTELVGKMNLRVLHGGAATLHSIRVMQPKQVRVESSDDHDKTREYVWKRSSHIAHVVSQKLINATKSMLQPPPIQTVTTYSNYFG